jgi:hypothetical protein
MYGEVGVLLPRSRFQSGPRNLFIILAPEFRAALNGRNAEKYPFLWLLAGVAEGAVVQSDFRVPRALMADGGVSTLADCDFCLFRETHKTQIGVGELLRLALLIDLH